MHAAVAEYRIVLLSAAISCIHQCTCVCTCCAVQKEKAATEEALHAANSMLEAQAGASEVEAELQRIQQQLLEANTSYALLEAKLDACQREIAMVSKDKQDAVATLRTAEVCITCHTACLHTRALWQFVPSHSSQALLCHFY